MLPLKTFSFKKPRGLTELMQTLALADEKTKIMAGGTDLIPNLKHRLYDIHSIISLKEVNELDFVSINDHHLEIGALTKLDQVSHHSDVKKYAPALVKASKSIASPQIRQMGTVGGNICLDTRCLYFNQSEFWRRSLGFCLKKDGCACHVIKTGKRCVAAASNDLATVLLALDAKITICSPKEQREESLENFYLNDGEKNNPLSPKEVVTKIKFPVKKGQMSGFYKLRHRNSIDFPMLSIAAVFELVDGYFKEGKIVINALVAKPKVIYLADYQGVSYNPKLVFNIASDVQRICHPQTNICDDPAWRKNMIAYGVKEALMWAESTMD